MLGATGGAGPILLVAILSEPAGRVEGSEYEKIAAFEKKLLTNPDSFDTLTEPWPSGSVG